MHIIKLEDYTYHFMKNHHWELNSIFSNTILKKVIFENLNFGRIYVNREVYWEKGFPRIYFIKVIMVSFVLLNNKNRWGTSSL